MVDQLQTIQSLKKLGLTEYEARSYMALLELGPTTADHLSKRSEVPISRVYSVLGDLEKKGFLRSAPGRPVRYRPVEPNLALDALMMANMKELEEAKNTILSYLEALFGQNLQRASMEYWYASDEGSIVRRLAQALGKAKERVVVSLAPLPVLASPSLSEAIASNLRMALKRRVQVSLVAHSRNVKLFLNKVRLEDELEVIDRDVRETLVLVDDTEVMWITTNAKDDAPRAYIFTTPVMVELAKRVMGEPGREFPLGPT